MTNHCEIVIFIQKVSAAQLKKIGKPVKVDEILINDVMNAREKVRTSQGLSKFFCHFILNESQFPDQMSTFAYNMLLKFWNAYVVRIPLHCC